ncbi:hypothetical protein [Roseibium sp.]|uniref:hypothetical protein n=1 Tax=Roseibium sp. TaxID=1936156 RepID=UPI003BAF7764
MIEAAMYVALGFCTASLIGLAILPAFYRRAARLTEEALRAVNPASYAEVRAAQDQERARYAVELTRVETRLDREREKAAGFHLEASRLRTEIEALQKSHQDAVAGLEAKLTAQDSEHHAVDMLSAEIKTLKEKLAESEKALAESWASTDDTSSEEASSKDKDQDTDNDWLPATDTMALATITGLEAEVATLKSKLAKYEPTVASEVEASLQHGTKSRLAELEAQLVDTESKYVTAQAEVTRLSLMLETAGVSDTAPDEQLEAQLKQLTAEISAQQTDLHAKQRKLDRLDGQNRKLRDDLSAAPELRQLREDFRTLSERISAAEAVSVKRVVKRTATKRKKAQDPGNTEAADIAASSAPPKAKVNGGRSKPVQRTKKATVVNAAPAEPAPTPSPSPAKSADIASAAEALVSRIVASSRNNSEDTAKADAAPDTETGTSAKRATGSARKAKTANQKKQDVA